MGLIRIPTIHLSAMLRGLGFCSIALTLPPPAFAERAVWTTDPAVGPTSTVITLELDCTGNSICSFITGYSSTRNPGMVGSGLADLDEGGSLELLLDKLLSVPPVMAWAFDIDFVVFDPSVLGTPTISAGVFFGVGGGPFLIPGLTFSAFGPTLINETLPVGTRLDIDLDGLPPVERVMVVGPGFEVMSGIFEMLDATRFEIRDLVVSFSGFEIIPLAELACCPLQPGELTVTTTGQTTINLRGDIAPLVQLSVGNTDLSWTATASALGFDVVRGDLGVLRSTGGDFISATDACLADNFSTSVLPYTAQPAPGTAFWILVRPILSTGNGRYDSFATSQVGPRDLLINGSAFSCP